MGPPILSNLEYYSQNLHRYKKQYYYGGIIASFIEPLRLKSTVLDKDKTAR